MEIKAVCVFLFVNCTVAATAGTGVFANQYDQISIRSEEILSGVYLHRDTIDKAIARLGEPNRVTVSQEPDAQSAVKTRSYEWNKRTCRLRIVVVGNSNTIWRVDVWGTSPEADVGTTGRGLMLGETIDDLRRVYSLRGFFAIQSGYLPPRQPPNNSCGFPILHVDFDRAGRVNHMAMMPEICY